MGRSLLVDSYKNTYFSVEELRDSTAHAEMTCIREGSNVLRSWRLAGTTLYVTLEPCPMCAGAILQARIDTLVWGAPNKLLGADGSWIRLFPDGDERGNTLELSDKPAPPPHPFHPKINIRRGVMASECANTMLQFFQLRQKKKTKQAETTEPSSSSVITSHHLSKFLRKMHNVFNILF